ncbi:MAG TPA: peptidyl-prolyl cis-trans isomerase [Polyangiaceae bacterium]|nr:peptidyl-prolyl cis-trans isomerase [Polyangiaceae bacterium]
MVFALAAVTASVVAEEDPSGALVVAKVGARSVTARALVQRLSGVPEFQLATLGSSPAEIKRNFLEQVVLRDELFAQGAEAKKLDQVTRARERIDHALRTARINALRENLDVAPAEIAEFYSENRARFDAPERIAMTRILCATRAEAAAVLAEAKSSGTSQRWNDLAREHSLDKATSMRGGALGFLARDGSSSEASVRADPALFIAASKVKDGEFVPEPIEEGKAYAVIWRRGGTPGVHRTLEEESAAIRQILARRKLADAVKALTDTLRAAEKVEEHPEFVDILEVSPEGSVAQRRRPGVAKRQPAQPPAPSATPFGLR